MFKELFENIQEIDGRDIQYAWYDRRNENNVEMYVNEDYAYIVEIDGRKIAELPFTTSPTIHSPKEVMGVLINLLREVG